MKAGWKLEPLGTLCAFENGDRGKNYPGKKALVPEGVPFINAGHLDDGAITWESMDHIPAHRYDLLGSGKIRLGDILFCLRGSLGKFGVVSRDTLGAIASSLVIVRPSEVIDRSYLAYYFRSALAAEMIDQYAGGAAQPNLAAKSLKAFEVPLPPLEEQQRIVAILDEAFEGLDRAKANAEANLASANDIVPSFRDRLLVELANATAASTLNDMCELIVDCEHKTAPLADEGYPSIRTPNIGPGYLILEGVNRVTRETYEKWTRRAVPRSGDLILAREAPAGNVGVVPDGEQVCLGQRTVLLRPKPNVDSQFLAELLMSSHAQKALLSKSTGSTVTHINLRDIRGFALPAMPPVEEQRQIARSVEACRALQFKTTEGARLKMEHLDLLRQSLLAKAFAGELT